MPTRAEPSPVVSGLDFRWPDTVHGPWNVYVEVDTSTGLPQCVGLYIRSYDGSYVAGAAGQKLLPGPGGLRELTTSELRAVRLPRLVAHLCATLPALIGHMTKDRPEVADHLARQREVLELGAGRRYDLSHFEEVARIYSEAAGDGTPTRAVAERLGLSRTAAAKQVARCRGMGLLGATKKGRPGGAITTARPTTKRGKK